MESNEMLDSSEKIICLNARNIFIQYQKLVIYEMYQYKHTIFVWVLFVGDYWRSKIASRRIDINQREFIAIPNIW